MTFIIIIEGTLKGYIAKWECLGDNKTLVKLVKVNYWCVFIIYQYLFMNERIRRYYKNIFPHSWSQPPFAISTLKQLLDNYCDMMNSGRGALFCTHYINDMGTQGRSTAGLAESIKYSAGSSALRRPCYLFRGAVTCLSVTSLLIKVRTGGSGERVNVRGRVCVFAWWPWLEGSMCAKCFHAVCVCRCAGSLCMLRCLGV